MNRKKLIVPLSALALVLSAGGGLVAAVHADSTTTSSSTAATTQTPTQDGTMQQREKPAAVGTVTAVSGNTITLTDKMNSTTYTVDATSATIEKMTASTTAGEKPTSSTITASDIAVGDTLMVQGTVSGTTITATKIHDGQMGMGGRGGHGPHISGTVTAVSGTTLTITGQDGKSYTVNGSNANAEKVTHMTVSDVQVGDTVGVEGTLDGTTVTARSIRDGQMPTPSMQTSK